MQKLDFFLQSGVPLQVTSSLLGYFQLLQYLSVRYGCCYGYSEDRRQFYYINEVTLLSAAPHPFIGNSCSKLPFMLWSGFTP